MSDSEQRTIALVTGAGSPTGIGFAVARALGQAGHRSITKINPQQISIPQQALIKIEGRSLSSGSFEDSWLIRDISSKAGNSSSFPSPTFFQV